MGRRITGLGVALAVLATLCVSSPPPAQAASGTMAIVGQMVVGNGIAYSCFDGKTSSPTANLMKCDPNSNTATVVLTASALQQLVSSPTSSKAAAVEGGISTISAGGGMVGHCGLSRGTLTGSIAPSLGPGTKSKSRGIMLSWVEMGGTMVVQGRTTKGEYFSGVLLIVPDSTNGSTCTNKTAKSFIVTGTLAFNGDTTPASCPASSQAAVSDAPAAPHAAWEHDLRALVSSGASRETTDFLAQAASWPGAQEFIQTSRPRLPVLGRDEALADAERRVAALAADRRRPVPRAVTEWLSTMITVVQDPVFANRLATDDFSPEQVDLMATATVGPCVDEGWSGKKILTVAAALIGAAGWALAEVAPATVVVGGPPAVVTSYLVALTLEAVAVGMGIALAIADDPSPVKN